MLQHLGSYWRRGACALLAAGLLSFAAPSASHAQADKVAPLPGVKLAYKDTGGSGAPVIFLHALTATSENWEPQVDAFVKAGYRVITFDRRGWGKSTADPATGPQPGTSSDDLEELAKYLKLDKFHLVGVAGGGFVALDYAAWKPERLLSLVVGASTGSLQEQEIKDFSKRISIPNVPWPSEWLEVGPSYIGGNPEGLAKWKHIADTARQKDAPSQPLRTPNTYAKISTITAPTLVVAGGADWLGPPALMRIWAAKIKNSEFAEIGDAGHSMNWEHPKEFNDIVIGFLKKH